MRRHLSLNEPPANEHIFAYKAKKPGEIGWRALRGDQIVAEFNRAMDWAGRKKITKHSFRAGGATTLLLSGVNPDHVRVKGRWAPGSKAFDRYWKLRDLILTRALTDIHLVSAER
jgi:hypothetical protein